VTGEISAFDGQIKDLDAKISKSGADKTATFDEYKAVLDLRSSHASRVALGDATLK
jgi:hypothetical protein